MADSYHAPFASAESSEISTADSTVYKVKGAVDTKYDSFENANLAYMNQNFPGWKHKYQTYLIPPRFEVCGNQWIPEAGANFPELQERHSDQNRETEKAVVEKFYTHCWNQKEPMFIFHSFKFENLASCMKHHNIETNENLGNQETDLIIVHREIGVILVETKGMDVYDDAQHKKAANQLKNAEKLLRKLHNMAKNLVKKVFAFPNLPNKKLNISNCDSESDQIIYLLENDMIDFKNWWNKNIKGSHQGFSTNHDIYCKLVPKLLCGRGDICLYLNMKNIKRIGRHETLKAIAGKQPAIDIKPLQNIQTSFDTVKTHIYLTPDQSIAWKKSKQVICGPYGCGKTILLQCKAMELARHDHKVLVIVPNHLKQVYQNFFDKNLSKKCSNINLFSVEEFYENFDNYATQAKVRHVFVDELLWRYVDSNCDSSLSHYKATGTADNLVRNFQKTVLSLAFERQLNQLVMTLVVAEDNTSVSIKFLDLLNYLLNRDDKLFVWIVPNYYAVLCKLFTNKGTKEVAHFEKIFQSEENVTVLTTIMRTSKLHHQYIKKNEFEEICMLFNIGDIELIKRAFFHSDLYGRLLGGYLGHSISGHNEKVCYYDPEIYIDDFEAFCVETLLTEIDELLSVVNIPKCDSSIKWETKSQLNPRDIAIISRDDGYVQLDSILKSVNEKSIGQWTLCTIEQYHQGYDGVPICYSQYVASLEWPVVIHIRHFKRAKISHDGLYKTLHCFGAQEEESVIPSRCMLQYILICPKDDFVIDERTNPRPKICDKQFTNFAELHNYISDLKILLPFSKQLSLLLELFITKQA